MDTEKFISICKKKIRKYVEEHLDKSNDIPSFEIYEVWNCKTLQNNKALLNIKLPEFNFKMKCCVI